MLSTVRRAVLALLLLPVGAAGTAHAASQDASDVRLAADVRRALGTAVQLTIFDDVSARLEEGHVVLTGKVTMPYKRTDVEKRVARIEGIRSVRNAIDVLPVSRYDDELRHKVARAIYGNPSFWTYAAMAHPPIHIVVEDGRVTLTGVVNSTVERALARSLATGLGELSVTNALRTDAEAKASCQLPASSFQRLPAAG